MVVVIRGVVELLINADSITCGRHPCQHPQLWCACELPFSRMGGGNEETGASSVDESGVLTLPKASIKRIMKLDPDTKAVSAVGLHPQNMPRFPEFISPRAIIR